MVTFLELVLFDIAWMSWVSFELNITLAPMTLTLTFDLAVRMSSTTGKFTTSCSLCFTTVQSSGSPPPSTKAPARSTWRTSPLTSRRASSSSALGHTTATRSTWTSWGTWVTSIWLSSCHPQSGTSWARRVGGACACTRAVGTTRIPSSSTS